MVAHYREQYGLNVTILRPLGVAPSLVDPETGQAGGVALIDFVNGIFPGAAADPNAVLIGVTPLDIHYEERTDWPFVFGVRGFTDDPKAIVSTYRMNPETYGEEPDDDTLFSRTRKMTLKYIGMLYYGLPESDNPDDPLYNRIYSVDTLDRLGEPLPVTRLSNRSHSRRAGKLCYCPCECSRSFWRSVR